MSEPLTPADCDLRHFKGMTLEIERLRRSSAWRACKRNPELAFYMLNLWLASWHEVPAASLENDDDALCDLAMCSPDRWAEVSTDVLRGWIECSDGRLYHPVVAEVALHAFGKSQKSKKAIQERWKNNEKNTDVQRPKNERNTKKEKKERKEDTGEREDNSTSVGFADSHPDDEIPVSLPKPKTAATRSTGCDAFDAAWKLWPRPGRERSAKAKALKAWRRAATGDAEKLEAVRAYLASADAKKSGGEFVPAFERWLTGRLDTWIEQVREAVAAPAVAPRKSEPEWWAAVRCAFAVDEFFGSDWALWRGCEPVTETPLTVRASSANAFAALTRDKSTFEHFEIVTGKTVVVLPPERAMVR